MKLARYCVPLILLGACNYKQPVRSATTPLDRALVFTEKDHYGTSHLLSGQNVMPEPGKSNPSVHVPVSTRVDVNSVIEIRVDKTMLADGVGQVDISQKAEDLKTQKKQVVDLIEGLSKVVQARTRAIDTYQASLGKPVDSEEFKTFAKAKAEAGDARKALRAAIRELYPNTHERNEILRTVTKDATLGLLQKELQTKIDELADEYRKLRQRVEQSSLSLRLEAFLIGKDSDPRPIHLQGYDKIDEQKLTTFDRFSLNLSDSQLKILKARMADSVELANEANAARRQQISLRQLFLRHTGETGAAIAAAVDEAKALKEALAGRKIETVIADAKAAGEELLKILREEAATTVDAMKRLPAEIAGSSPGIQTVLGILAQIEKLRSDWDAAEPMRFAQLVATGNTLLASLSDLPAALAKVPEEIEESLTASMTSLSQDNQDRVRQRWNGSDSKKTLGEYLVLVQRSRQVLEATMVALKKAKGVGDRLLNNDIVPLASLTQAPGSQKVPFESIKDTFINLQRTARSPGDSITMRSTLFDGDKPLEQSSASLDVTRYGYYADWAPSVVLAEPNRAAPGQPDNFQFAPSLSWMHRYSPRPESNSWYDPISRFLDPAIGLNATFLNMQPDTSLEVGLGITVSFWGNRLQGGVGYNLMADSADEGGVYFFIGSSLIPMLQDLGLRSPETTGIQ